MPKISIITPVYKVENYLPKCIDSILRQTFSDFELYIVDDGSPDKSGKIADDYEKKDSRVHVIHKENGGAPSARNAGIERACGDYLYFPDSDDWLDPGYLQELYDAAKKTNVDLVISGFTMEYHENHREQSYRVSMPEASYLNKDMVRKNLHIYFNNMMMAVPWNKLYKRDYIMEHSLRFPDLKWDDLHFNMDVIKDIDSVAISSSTGYHYFRSRADSETTTVYDSWLYKKRKEQFEHIHSVYQHWNITDPDIMSSIYGYYAARLVQCVQEIAISDDPEKKKLVGEILADPLTIDAFRYGKIDSRPLEIAAWPMKAQNLSGSIAVGQLLGFVKIHMSDLFYKIKSKTVNKAR